MSETSDAHTASIRLQTRAKDGSMCALCYAVTHPKAHMKRDLQTKERALLAWLEALMANAPSHLSMRHDQVVSGGCGKERPDFCIDVLSHVVILECDENRHTRELPECWQQRVWRISDSFGGRPVVFLRFNPDKYDERGTKHPSCFGLKHGVLVLTGTADWLARVKLVAARLLHHFAHEFLFYGDDARARDDGASGSADAPVAPNPYEAFARKVKRARLER
mmetsp:Transcript_36947/g.91936  ORF Transcript_36947/g.91936 Transcript_36947/m.91936 type:complete len:221 (+) Transcript_36947:169-831(+)